MKKKIHLPKEGDVLIRKRFAWFPKLVNKGADIYRIWFRFYYEKREYKVILSGMIEGWDITYHLEEPKTVQLKVVQ